MSENVEDSDEALESDDLDREVDVVIIVPRESSCHR